MMVCGTPSEHCSPPSNTVLVTVEVGVVDGVGVEVADLLVVGVPVSVVAVALSVRPVGAVSLVVATIAAATGTASPPSFASSMPTALATMASKSAISDSSKMDWKMPGSETMAST